MLFIFVYMFVILGLLVAAIPGLMPLQSQAMIPDFFRFILFFFGFIFSFLGILLIHGRALKTGTNHLLEYGRPETIIWFFVNRDGTIKITPAMREVEGALYSKELDAVVNDMKSYRLFDHSVRIVPEGLGHTADLDMVLYATLLKTKNGFANIREARKSVKGQVLYGKQVLAREMVSENPYEDFEEYYGKTRK